jgi:hypothetical protein
MVSAIEAHLEERDTDHHGFILAKAVTVINANQHVDPEMKDAVEIVIGQRIGAVS